MNRAQKKAIRRDWIETILALASAAMFVVTFTFIAAIIVQGG